MDDSTTLNRVGSNMTENRLESNKLTQGSALNRIGSNTTENRLDSNKPAKRSALKSPF